MADRSVVVRLLANITDFKASMKDAERSVKGVGDQAGQSSQQATTSLGRLSESAQKNEKSWRTAGTALAGFGAVTTLALAGTVKAAMDWESAWAGVTKTVSGTPQELAKVEEGLRGLARTLPSTHDEIAAVAEAAGQLGVQTGSVVAFTKTMVDLGQTTNLSADEAATSIAQMMNVMQTAPQDVGRLGASLVALGNAGASTESDILRMASYITGSAKLIGASESDVLALANAMTSMGINAERGGGVMTRVMQDIYGAVATGGDKLQGFADVAGMSAADFAKAFRDDPVRAIDSFIQGLNGVEASGGNVVSTLNDLGYKGTQDTAVLLQMKGAGDLLTDSLDLGNKAWQENTALVQEAAKRYDTTASQIAIAKNNITDAAIEIGEALLPALADLAGSLADVAGWFADLPDGVQATIGGLAGVVGVAGLVGGAFLLLFPRVIETYKAFQTLSIASPGVASGLGTVGKAAGIAGVFFAVTAAIGAMIDSMGDAAPTMEETTKALLAMGDSVGRVDEMFQFRGGDLFTADINGVADAAARLTDPSLLNRLDDFGGSLTSIVTFGGLGSSEGAAAREAIIKQFDQLGQSLALMVESGNTDLAAKQFGLLATEWERGGGKVSDLKDLMPAYGEALIAADNQQKLAAESAKGMAEASGAAGVAAAGIAPAVESTYGSLAAYADALGLSGDAVQDLIDKANDLGSTLASFVDPLGAYTGLLDEKKTAEQDAAQATADATASTTDSWETYAKDVGVSIDEYMRRLEEQVAAQENWQVNMLRLAGRVSAGTITELANMGVEGADLVAKLVNASDAELDRFDDITYARSKEATDAWGAQLTLAGPVLAEIGKTAGQGVVDELAAKLRAGTTTVAEIAAQYGVSLADGVNPILTSLGKQAINGYKIRPNAEGNLYEDHTAQIAAGGDWRMWAEPETGGEAYIPLSPAKRGRSLDIWRETGKRLGVEVQQYAQGSIVDLGRRLQGMGARVTENPAFGGVAMGGHGRTSLHYTGDAIDVNTRPGTSALEQQELAPMAALARQLGFRTIFMAPDHFNHLHVDNGGGPNMGSGGAPAVVLPKPPSTAPYGVPISTAADAVMQKAYDEATAWLVANTTPPMDGAASGFVANSGPVQDQVRSVANQYGWGAGAQWNALVKLVQGESGWNPNAANKTSSARGLFQKMTSLHGPIEATAAGQAQWGLNYIKGAYGSPVSAYAKWSSRSPHWYGDGGISDTPGSVTNPHVRDQGGPLMPGYTFNGTGGQETVVPNRVVDSAAATAPRVVQEIHHHHRYDVDVRASGDYDAAARAVAARMAKQERRALAGV